jgi:antitoxin YefM
MEAITYSEARKNLKKHMDYAYQSNDPVYVVRKNQENVVIVSAEDYNSLTETQYLMSTEANRKNLRESIAQLRAGKTVKMDINDL